jgi:FtsP/CotA-like multicopper oxidase with cupredoxin domain
MRRYRQPIIAGLFLLAFVVGGYIWTTRPSAPVTSKRIDVTVTGGKSMSPSTWTAHQNDSVIINITSDTDGEVHLHGYDIPFELTHSVLYTKMFTADKTGDFPIEWETTSTPLGDFKVSP